MMKDKVSRTIYHLMILYSLLTIGYSVAPVHPLV